MKTPATARLALAYESPPSWVAIAAVASRPSQSPKLERPSASQSRRNGVTRRTAPTSWSCSGSAAGRGGRGATTPPPSAAPVAGLGGTAGVAGAASGWPAPTGRPAGRPGSAEPARRRPALARPARLGRGARARCGELSLRRRRLAGGAVRAATTRRRHGGGPDRCPCESPGQGNGAGDPPVTAGMPGRPDAWGRLSTSLGAAPADRHRSRPSSRPSVVFFAVGFLAAVFFAVVFFAVVFFAVASSSPRSSWRPSSCAALPARLAGPAARLSASSSRGALERDRRRPRRPCAGWRSSSPSVTYGPKRPSLTTIGDPDSRVRAELAQRRRRGRAAARLRLGVDRPAPARA